MSSNDTSEYFLSPEEMSAQGLATVVSESFTNLRLLYSSATTTTEVWLATRYGKRYILKAVQRGLRGNLLAELALQKEFDIGITLDHPNIRRTVGFENTPELGNVIILEYFDGISLDEFLKTADIDSRTARALLAKIASALSYLHARQIVHRDLKPANILVSADGANVSIIDFNLSDSAAYTYLKNPAGTKKYMAPEQASPADKPSVLSDIYSYGLIINEVAEASKDSALNAIAKKCTDPDPEKRPQAVKDIKLNRSGILGSAYLTIILAAICTALLVAIIMQISQ